MQMPYYKANALQSLEAAVIVLEVEATITKRGQTTVPAAIRKALQVGGSGGIVYRLEDNGQVSVVRKELAYTDPVIGNFLSFLAADMMARPEALRPVTAEWLDGLKQLIEGVEFDMDAPLSDDDA
jgi:antitoxin PrlF